MPTLEDVRSTSEWNGLLADDRRRGINARRRRTVIRLIAYTLVLAAVIASMVSIRRRTRRPRLVICVTRCPLLFQCASPDSVGVSRGRTNRPRQQTRRLPSRLNKMGRIRSSFSRMRRMTSTAPKG